MRATQALLLLLAASSLLGARASDYAGEAEDRHPSLATFFQNNPLYHFISDPVPELLQPGAAYTVFIPLLNNQTASEAQAFPQLSPNLVLSKPYASAAELLDAGSVTNQANVTILLEFNEAENVIDATFVELGDATAKIYPVAFPIGNSFLYPITVITSGQLPQDVGAAAPTAGK